jgi:hypothetical protein
MGDADLEGAAEAQAREALQRGERVILLRRTGWVEQRIVDGDVVERRLETPGREPWSKRAIAALNRFMLRSGEGSRVMGAKRPLNRSRSRLCSTIIWPLVVVGVAGAA